MPSADSTVAGPDHPLTPHDRVATTEWVRTAQRWTAGTLVLATVVLLGYLAAVVGAAWLVGSAVEVVAGRELGDLDVIAVAADVAPVLLVGWCTGLATCAALCRGEALGPRASGLVAGAVGALAGAAVLSLAL
ncbi:hypothetical protein GCM10023168_37360 [Fodinibacter luteus]|uniref:Uncharacterized protein n=1 Tax=Fodinibacter luteus TaxID=552064 RepID=A0ABP8KSB4_9MICO